jgi:subtilisin family serine protease
MMYFSGGGRLCPIILLNSMRMSPLTPARLIGYLPRLCTAFAALLTVALVPVAHAADTVAGEVLVKLRSPAALPPIIATYPGAVATQFGTRPIYRLKLPAGTDVGLTVTSLRGNADVLLVEPNTTQQSPEARKSQAWTIGSASDYLPQWAPTAMRLSLAHTFSKGAGVKVAVLDTGVDPAHPALANKLLPGYDFVDNDSIPSEVGTTANLGYGHGTHVAGLIALAAPLAKIIPYRVLDLNGEGNAWVLAEAVQRAIDDGAHIINLSLGTPVRSDVLTSIAKLVSCEPPDDTDPILNYSDPGYAADKARCAGGPGLVMIAAAGNDGNSSVKEYPAAVSAYGLLSVGASNQSKHLATFSNSGSWVQVAAPGEGITSSVPLAATASGYAVWSGTSMAAPLAAGAAALLRSAEPNLSAADLVRRIARTASPLIGTNIKQVDAAALVERCNMDIDGDGQVLSTTDGLMLMRAMMGMTGTAVSSAAAPGSPRNDWAIIRPFLVDVCGMNLP